MIKLSDSLYNLCKEINGTIFLRGSSKYDFFAETISSESMSKLCDNNLPITDKMNSPGHWNKKSIKRIQLKVLVVRITKIFHPSYLTHQAQCRIWQVSVNSTIIDFDNCFSPIWCQAIIGINTSLSSIIQGAWNFSAKFGNKIQQISHKTAHSKMSPAKKTFPVVMFACANFMRMTNTLW